MSKCGPSYGRSTTYRWGRYSRSNGYPDCGNHGARVTLCDINTHRLEIARAIGAAEEVIDVTGQGWEDQIPNFGFRVVLDVAGVPRMEDKLLRAVERRGMLLLIAGRSKVEYTFNIGQGREITIKQNGHFDNSDLHNLCHLVSRGLVQIAPFIQDVVPVTEAKHIFNTLRDEPQKLFGTVFDWRTIT